MLRRTDAALQIATGDTLDLRWFRVTEAISELTIVEVVAVCENPDIDLRETVGQPAMFRLQGATPRQFEGVIASASQERVEATGSSSYRLTLMPRLWLLTHRTNLRVFQNLSELSIAQLLLDEWNIPCEVRVSRGYAKRSFLLQYGESDYEFMKRLLSEAGICFRFGVAEDGAVVILDDSLHTAEETHLPLAFFDNPPDHVTHWARDLSVTREVRPSRLQAFDVDYRRPAEAQPKVLRSHGLVPERALELVSFEAGAFLFEQEVGGDTPAADDRGIARTVHEHAEHFMETKLLAARAGAIQIAFEASVGDVEPGTLRRLLNHPHRDVANRPLLVVSNVIEGGWDRDLRDRVLVTHVDVPYRPPYGKPAPRVQGLESATVVGPSGDDIHTDEFGRVRVQFHWDRYGTRDERSSCWIPVSQAWGGAGFGAVALPRVGQEVLVQFLGGNPNRPIVVGRVFTATQPAPYSLPGLKQVSGIRSKTTGLAAQALAAMLNVAKGMLGGPAKPIAPELLGEKLKHPFFNAKSPDQSTHGWLGSELTFTDQPGSEQVYLQAQRDLKSVVKNSSTNIIGNSQATQVGTDDILAVGNRQQCTIGDNQSLAVGGDRVAEVLGTEALTTVGDLSVTTHANLTTTVTAKWSSSAFIAEHTAEDLMVLKVGASRIVLRPSFIIIQSTDVFINPGDAATDAAIENATRPQSESEKQQAAAEAAATAEAAAARVEFDAAMTDPAMREAYEGYSRTLRDPASSQSPWDTPDQHLLSGEAAAVNANMDLSVAHSFNQWEGLGF